MSYFEGIKAASGAILCNALDEGVQQALIKKIISSRPTEAGASCAHALTELATAITSPSERSAKVPPLHVTTTGDGAVVSYVGPLTHKARTFTLVKHGSGWLIDKIDGKG